MKWNRAILLAACGLTWAAAQADPRPYTMKDLQALADRKSWSELIMHLQDVPPAERAADWNKLVETACLREGLDAYAAIYCTQELQSLLIAAPADRDFAWRAGKWVRVNQQSWAAVPFFDKAIPAAADAAEKCADPDVELAVMSGLALPADTGNDIVAQSQRLAFDACWKELQSPLIQNLSEGAYFQANACPGLKKKKALKGLKARLCEGK
jgi:hypothetical protein